MSEPDLRPHEVEILNGLDGAFSPWIREARRRVWARGVTLFLKEGLRSRGQQAVYHNEPPKPGELGARGVAPGKSKHEIGFAVDVEGPTSPEQWRIVAEEVRRLGLESGIDYKPVAEPWHIEAPVARSSLATYRVLTLMVGLGVFAVGWAAVASAEKGET